MDEQYIGTIQLFAGNFAPQNFMFCQGQLLAISQYSALYSLLGTMYGGDGRTTFALPDLRGRAPIGFGQGIGLSNTYKQGQLGGTETNTILVDNMPPHNHNISINANNQAGSTSAPAIGSSIAATVVPAGRDLNEAYGFNSQAPNTPLNGGSATCDNTGSGKALNNIQPFQAINYIICITGLYPSRS